MRTVGCVIKALAILIVIISISYYLYIKYEDDIIDYGKEKVSIYFADKVNNKINSLEQAEFKDSLHNVMNDYFDAIKDESFSDIISTSKTFVEKINFFLKDKLIDKEELKELRQFIKDEK